MDDRGRIVSLLDEYGGVCVEMDKIRSCVVGLRDETKRRLGEAKGREEKKRVFGEFKERVVEIKNDRKLWERYAALKVRRNGLRESLVSGDDMNYLLKKYGEDKQSVRVRVPTIELEDLHYSEQHNELNMLVRSIKIDI
ncbi:MAG: hypothetical protein Hyperionvirus20_27 [Hyperionvirus sp.]|uniref:Uncharacterized protein n=1 Tax=Hyperionvirus sp. TaxID=2487770 RepID=A0A3G5AFU1_9VIRU|nr:MAG: hypothetical protein Hyperionvirus20_27 [Hyperionvirus sp.]